MKVGANLTTTWIIEADITLMSIIVIWVFYIV